MKILIKVGKSCSWNRLWDDTRISWSDFFVEVSGKILISRGYLRATIIDGRIESEVLSVGQKAVRVVKVLTSAEKLSENFIGQMGEHVPNGIIAEITHRILKVMYDTRQRRLVAHIRI